MKVTVCALRDACRFVEVAAHHYPDYVGFARWYYRGKHLPLYQIVWSSNDGHHPRCPEASEHFKEWEPVLGEAPKNHRWPKPPNISRPANRTDHRQGRAPTAAQPTHPRTNQNRNRNCAATAARMTSRNGQLRSDGPSCL